MVCGRQSKLHSNSNTAGTAHHAPSQHTQPHRPDTCVTAHTPEPTAALGPCCRLQVGGWHEGMLSSTHRQLRWQLQRGGRKHRTTFTAARHRVPPLLPLSLWPTCVLTEVLLKGRWL
jgi:hypothetical protein